MSPVLRCALKPQLLSLIPMDGTSSSSAGADDTVWICPAGCSCLGPLPWSWLGLAEGEQPGSSAPRGVITLCGPSRSSKHSSASGQRVLPEWVWVGRSQLCPVSGSDQSRSPASSCPLASCPRLSLCPKGSPAAFKQFLLYVEQAKMMC